MSLMGVLSGIEMALWDIVGKAVGKPVYELLGGKVHERLRSYTYLYPDEPGSHAYSDSPVYSVPKAAAERALEYLEQGFTAVKFDPAGPYSTFDPRQPSLERLALSEAFCKTCARRSAKGATSCLARTASSRFPARCAWPAASSRTSRCGSRSRRPRGAGRNGQGRGAMPYPIATGERLTTKYEFARRARDRAPPRSCRWTSGGSADCSRPRRSLRWRRRTMRKSRRTSIAGRSSARPTFSSRRAAPNFLILESIETWDGFHAQIWSKSRSAGRRATSSRRRAGARGRARRRGRRRSIPRRAMHCISCRDFGPVHAPD